MQGGKYLWPQLQSLSGDYQSDHFIFIDNKYFGGYKQLKEQAENGQLKKLLD